MILKNVREFLVNNAEEVLLLIWLVVKVWLHVRDVLENRPAFKPASEPNCHQLVKSLASEILAASDHLRHSLKVILDWHQSFQLDSADVVPKVWVGGWELYCRLDLNVVERLAVLDDELQFCHRDEQIEFDLCFVCLEQVIDQFNHESDFFGHLYSIIEGTFRLNSSH